MSADHRLECLKLAVSIGRVDQLRNPQELVTIAKALYDYVEGESAPDNPEPRRRGRPPKVATSEPDPLS